MEYKMQDSILLLPYNSVQVVRDFFSVPITGHQQDTAKWFRGRELVRDVMTLCAVEELGGFCLNSSLKKTFS